MSTTIASPPGATGKCSSFGETGIPQGEDGGPLHDGSSDAAASTLTHGQLARWRFDEMSGTTVKNDVSTASPGMMTNATFVTGKIGATALAFDGTSSRVRVVSSETLDVTTAFTLSVWMNVGPKKTSAAEDQRFVARTPIDFKLNDRNPQIQVGAGYAIASAAIPEGEWHHVTATYDNGTPNIYVDGTPSALSPNSIAVGPVPMQSGPLYIGSNSTTDGFAHGMLDDVRTWNRALTPAEVAELVKER
ncbi:MAG: hypothetical protein JWP87_3599 [Labilithrix sp.]|nr:hypothetical protein [Labilithrix sp.]